MRRTTTYMQKQESNKYRKHQVVTQEEIFATFTCPLSGIGVSLSLSPLSLDFEDHPMNNRVFQEPECKHEAITKFLSCR
jgi:hypothetical protein